MDTLSPLVAMHLLDRSCVSVGIFLKFHAMFPNEKGQQDMHVFVAIKDNKMGVIPT